MIFPDWPSLSGADAISGYAWRDPAGAEHVCVSGQYLTPAEHIRVVLLGKRCIDVIAADLSHQRICKERVKSRGHSSGMRARDTLAKAIGKER